MAYNKTNWVNGETPVNASNMNNIENGIYNNSLKADQVGDLSALTTTAKNNLVNAINEIKDDLDNKQDKFIIENATLATNRSFSANDAVVFTVPAKTGYTAYVLKPYVVGAWSDKFAVYVPWSTAENIGIRNDSGNSYTWSVYCAVLYIKNEE